MKRKLIYSLALIAVAIMTALAMKETAPAAPAKAASVRPPAETNDEQVIAALGRVEPQSEELRIGAEVSGKLARVLVREGQRVARGDLLAVLENSELQAQLLSAQARAKEKEAELRRIVNG